MGELCPVLHFKKDMDKLDGVQWRETGLIRSLGNTVYQGRLKDLG